MRIRIRCRLEAASDQFTGKTTGKLRGWRIRIKVDLRVELNLGLLRHWAAYVLISLGAVVALAHLGTHASAFGLRAAALEDLLVGYPTAAVLAVLGATLLPTGRR